VSEEESKLKTEATININTIILSVILGVMSWVGYTTQQTAVAMAVANEKAATHDRELLDLRARVAAVEVQIAKMRNAP
jgi:predicted negative regulator of RcsB-dependent stress response